MTKITLQQAEEAFEKAKRTNRSKAQDKVYRRKPKYVLDVDDERGSRYLTKTGTNTYDFEGVDAGKIVKYQNKIDKLKETIKEVTKKTNELL